MGKIAGIEIRNDNGVAIYLVGAEPVVEIASIKTKNIVTEIKTNHMREKVVVAIQFEDGVYLEFVCKETDILIIGANNEEAYADLTETFGSLKFDDEKKDSDEDEEDGDRGLIPVRL